MTELSAARFEDRYLELRETLAQRGAAWREGEDDGAEVIAASGRLDAFHERTGPLLEDLVATARKVASNETLDDDWECVRASDLNRLRTLLVVLDEEADRG